MLEVLQESLSRVVYHYTSTAKAVLILQQGVFKLTSSLGSQHEHALSMRGYPYFFSTTRTVQGGYHQRVPSSGVLFQLSGDYYNQRYPSRSVDYYQDRDDHTRIGRPHEAEDRLFSRRNTLSIAGVSAVYIYCNPDSEHKHLVSAAKAYHLAVERGIPAYYFEQIRDWRRLNTSASTVPAPVSELSGLPTPVSASGVDRWLELINATSTEQLSEPAQRQAYNLVYYVRPDNIRPDDWHNLKNDISNERQPGNTSYASAVKLTDYLYQRYRTDTGVDFKRFISDLHQKWKQIKDQEHTQRVLKEWRCDWTDSDARDDDHGDYNSALFNELATRIYELVFAGNTVFLQPPGTDTVYIVRRPSSWRHLTTVCNSLGAQVNHSNKRFYGTVPVSFRYIPGRNILSVIESENIERLGRWRKANRSIAHNANNREIKTRFDLGPGVYQIVGL